jgi:hypothetical protein
MAAFRAAILRARMCHVMTVSSRADKLGMTGRRQVV